MFRLLSGLLESTWAILTVDLPAELAGISRWARQQRENLANEDGGLTPTNPLRAVVWVFAELARRGFVTLAAWVLVDVPAEFARYRKWWLAWQAEPPDTGAGGAILSLAGPVDEAPPPTEPPPIWRRALGRVARLFRLPLFVLLLPVLLAWIVAVSFLRAGRALVRSAVSVTVWAYFRYLSLSPLRKVLVAGLLVGTATGLYYARERLARQTHIVALWGVIENSLMRGNLKEAEQQLADLITRVPDDKIAVGRLQALRTGVGDPNDPTLTRAILLAHADHGRIRAAAREARKYVVLSPRHLPSRVLLSLDAQLRGDSQEARGHLELLPKVDLKTPDLMPGPVLLLAGLCYDLGLDARLRETMLFLFGELLPLFQNSEFELNAGERLLLVELHARSLPRLNWDRRLAEYTEQCRALAVSVATEPTIHPAQLRRLSLVLEVSIGQTLPALEARGTIGRVDAIRRADRYERDLERLWDKLLTIAPNDLTGHIGHVTQLARRTGLPAALKAVDQSIAVCGVNLELTLLKAKLLDRLAASLEPEQRPGAYVRALEYLAGQLVRFPDATALYNQISQTSLAAEKPAVGLALLRQGRAGRPSAEWADHLEAVLAWRAGKPDEALAALDRFFDPLETAEPDDPTAKVGDPYTRSWLGLLTLKLRLLCETGQAGHADCVLYELLHQRRTDPDRLAAVASTFLQVGEAELALQWADELLLVAPESGPVHLLAAAAADRLCSRPDGSYLREPARRAAAEFAWLLAKRPSDLVLRTQVVRLRLLGVGDKAGAVAEAEPLFKASVQPRAPAPLLYIAGLAHQAAEQPDLALSTLQAGVAAAPQDVPMRCAMVRVLLSLKRTEKAAEVLATVEPLLRSERDRREHREVRELLSQLSQPSP